MDISKTTEPRSDQQNYDDYANGPKTVTVSEVKKGSAEQPVELHLVEYPGRPYKPGKSMRRVLIAAWGSEASAYIGRQLELFGDPTIRFGKDEVGGIRIAKLSHITEPVTVNLTVTRGRRAPFTVLPIAPGRDWLTELKQTGGDIDLITALGKAAKEAGASREVIGTITKAYHDAKTGTEEQGQ